MRPHQLSAGDMRKAPFADDRIMDADRLARFDRADIDQFRLDAHDLAEMNAGRRLMRDELAETHVPGKAAHRIVAGGDRLDTAAMGDRKFRFGVAAQRGPRVPQLRRKLVLGQLRSVIRQTFRLAAAAQCLDRLVEGVFAVGCQRSDAFEGAVDFDQLRDLAHRR